MPRAASGALQAIPCRVQIEIDYFASGIDDVAARVTDRRRANVTGCRQQVVADTRQFALDPEDSVLFALRYEFGRIPANWPATCSTM